jgi:hypothetical protein
MIKIISWLGTVSSILGSFIIAFGFMKFGYIAFIIGCVSWLYVGIKSKTTPLIVLNGTFFVANIIGLTRAII